MHTVIERALHLRLCDAGMQVSAADRFVIAASQTLISASEKQLSFEQINDRLASVHQRLRDQSDTREYGFVGAHP